jgi:hypothetical protein
LKLDKLIPTRRVSKHGSKFSTSSALPYECQYNSEYHPCRLPHLVQYPMIEIQYQGCASGVHPLCLWPACMFTCAMMPTYVHPGNAQFTISFYITVSKAETRRESVIPWTAQMVPIEIDHRIRCRETKRTVQILSSM